jgi:hypothetical protein
MAAPAGNQFWMQRTKHGRDKLFSDPEIFWQECVRYFNWCDNNPLKEEDFRGKDAVSVTLNKMRAYSWSGLGVFLDCDLRRYKSAFNGNVGEDQVSGLVDLSQDFVAILSRVSQIMFTQKFEGAAAGLLKENVIVRDLSLAEKSDVRQLNINQTDFIEYTEVSDEALKEIKNANKRLKSNS